MENTQPKPRRVETLEQRTARKAALDRRNINAIRSEEDALDAMVRHSISTHGA